MDKKIINLVCVKKDSGYWVTVGKIYLGYCIKEYSELSGNSYESYVIIKNDKGVSFNSEVEVFKPLSEIRAKKLGELLS